MTSVRIQVLGEGGAWRAGVPQLAPRRLPTIVAFLLQQPGFAASRERIAGTLWPDGSDSAALHALASALWRIRAALGEGSPLAGIGGELI